MLARAPRCPTELQRKASWRLSDFVLVKKLGVGGASAVYKGYLKGSSTSLAVKMYFKRKMTPLNLHQVHREVAIHAQLDHPNVVALVRLSRSSCCRAFLCALAWPGTVAAVRLLAAPQHMVHIVVRLQVVQRLHSGQHGRVTCIKPLDTIHCMACASASCRHSRSGSIRTCIAHPAISTHCRPLSYLPCQQDCAQHYFAFDAVRRV